MKASEIARAASTSTDTVRYYTRTGLLAPVRNPANGYHEYAGHDLRRLQFIRQAQLLGFSLADIRRILAQADAHTSPCPLVRELFEAKLTEVEERLRQLTQQRDRMRHALASWATLPDATPNGESVCHLIEHWATENPHEQP